jgi:transcriptional regulator with XRE-family HTH domain
MNHVSDGNQDSEKPGMTLGQHLASIRTGRGLTLRQVEEATNKEVSNAYLSQIENDKIKQPSPNILNALAELYGVDYIDLMERAGYLPSTRIRSVDKTGLRSNAKRHGKVATFAEYNLTAEEEAALLRYLKFMRHEKKERDESR